MLGKKNWVVKMNSKAYYELHKKRQELEEEIKILEKRIRNLKQEMLKKDLPERKKIQKEINKIVESEKSIELQASLKTINFCINTVFYS
jgi:transposase